MRGYQGTIFFFLMFSAVVGLGQDIHYSQFDKFHLELNPAMTGMTRSNGRLNFRVRNQAITYRNMGFSNITMDFSNFRLDTYTALTASYDQDLDLGNGSILGLGLTAHTDQTDELAYRKRKVNISAAYSKKMAGDSTLSQRLSFGIDIGVTQRRIDLTNARWPSQNDGNGGWDSSIVVDLPPDFNSDFLHNDFGIGVMWFGGFGDRKQLNLGLAMQHIAEPNVSFFEYSEVKRLQRRILLNGGGEWAISPNLSLLPRFLFSNQDGVNAVTAGSSLRIYLGEEQVESIQFGFTGRYANENLDGLNDAIIISGALNFEKLRIGLSYDATMSVPGNSEFSGDAVELMIGYYIPDENVNYSLPTW